MAKSAATDEQLLAAISAAEQASVSMSEGQLATDRADAIDRFNGKTYGNERPGRSAVVSRDVADVVEGVLANVIKPFVAGDQVVQFNPRGPEDENAAQQETDYVNFVALERNNGFVVLASSFKDALLLRNGYVKCGWTKREDVMVERYEGQSDDQLAILLSDPEIEVVQHSEYPDPSFVPPPMPAPQAMQMGMTPDMPPQQMLHDVVVRRKSSTEYVETVPVPPDEIVISERTRTPSVQDTPFIQHRTHKTLSELRQLGYDVPDDIADDDKGETQEGYARDRFSFTGDDEDEHVNDPSRREVMFKESWIRFDYDGDGIAELRRVCSVGQEVLSNEETDLIPIAAFTGTIMSHQHLGVSLYDQVKDVAELKTAVLRQFMDNKYLINNTRTVVDVDRVNLDDLLESRPGGIVRANGDPATAVVPLVTPDTGASALQALEYIDSIRENRTGYTRYAQGMGSDSLINKTATGLMQASNQSQMRLEMVSRTIAETGIRDLFRIIHALTLKHANKAEKVRLRNKWVEVDPRTWARRTDLQISVGLGSGNSDQMFGKLMTMVPLMQQAQAMGLAGPQEAYNLGAELWKAAGFKNPDKFIHPPAVDPQTGQPQQPQPKPDPAVLAAQEQGKAVVQAEQIKAQTAQQKIQSDERIAIHKIEKEATTDLQKQLLANQAKLLIESQHAAVDEARLRLDQQNTMMEQQAAAFSKSIEQIVGQKIDMTPIVQMVQRVMAELEAPREGEIVRGPDGRAVGVRSVRRKQPAIN